MHTPTSYLSPLPLNLWDMNFSENFIWTGTSVPSRVTNALFPQSPKYRLSQTICEWLWSRIWGTSAEHFKKKIEWKRRTLPHHTQDTIWHRQKARTIFDMSFHPLYPSSVSCCAHCRKPLRNKAPTTNALDGRQWALFCLDQFYSKECNTPQALHQKLTSIAYRKQLSLFQEVSTCFSLHRWWCRGGSRWTCLYSPSRIVRWEGDGCWRIEVDGLLMIVMEHGL